MRSLIVVLVIIGLIFAGCGGGGGSTSESPQTETLAETKVLDINDTVLVGATVGKVTIPSKTDDAVKTVELIGDGAENFTVSSDGKISTKTALKSTNKTSKLSTKKIETTNKTYSFKVKITYASGKIVYINIQITVYSYSEVADVVNYFVAKDNSLHDVNATFGTFNVVVYADKELGDTPSNSTKAIYGKINGTSTNALLTVNSNYVNGTAFIVKVFKDKKLVGESEKAILSGGTLEFSDIATE